MVFSDIRETGIDQKAALDHRDLGLPRVLLGELPDQQSHALVVSGIRRCGKSTLLHQFVKKLGRDFFYYNFDDIRLADFSPADYGLLDRAIGETGARLLFFDEIQSADQWERYVRQKLDEGFQLVLTGSNASLLSRELGTHLTGRHLAKELFTFSYGEFCEFTGAEAGPESLGRYLEQGGFPEYLKTGNADILTQLQLDILYRDIAVRYGIRDVSSLRRLFVYLVSNPAQLVFPSKLPRTAGVKSPTTVLEYISYFETAYLLQLLPCFAWSLKAQSLAPKKVYVADPGIIKTGSLAFSGNFGALLENFVYNALRSVTRDLYYFSGKQGGECDFVVHPHDRPRCIQVCWELTADNRDRELKGLFEAMDFFQVNEGTILTYNARDLVLSGGKTVKVLPAWEWALGKDGVRGT